MNIHYHDHECAVSYNPKQRLGLHLHLYLSSARTPYLPGHMRMNGFHFLPHQLPGLDHQFFPSLLLYHSFPLFQVHFSGSHPALLFPFPRNGCCQPFISYNAFPGGAHQPLHVMSSSILVYSSFCYIHILRKSIWKACFKVSRIEVKNVLEFISIQKNVVFKDQYLVCYSLRIKRTIFFKAFSNMLRVPLKALTV